MPKKMLFESPQLFLPEAPKTPFGIKKGLSKALRIPFVKISDRKYKKIRLETTTYSVQKAKRITFGISKEFHSEAQKNSFRKPKIILFGKPKEFQWVARADLVCRPFDRLK